MTPQSNLGNTFKETILFSAYPTLAQRSDNSLKVTKFMKINEGSLHFVFCKCTKILIALRVLKPTGSDFDVT
jgi:hypothetical protein